MTKPDVGEYIMKLGFKKKVVLPEETADGIMWRKGNMNCKLQILVKLYRDSHFNTNVVTFTNISKDCMGMIEFSTIIDEIRKAPRFFLADFLNAQYQVESHGDLDDMEVGND